MKTRAALILVALVLIVGASGQNGERLQELYGNPVGEVYSAGDDLILTTSLDENKNVCAIVIEHQSHGRKLTDAELNAVLEKVAPARERGAYVMGTFLNINCLPDNDCAGVTEDYKRLSITKIGGTNQYRHVTVRYHRPECESKMKAAK